MMEERADDKCNRTTMMAATSPTTTVPTTAAGESSMRHRTRDSDFRDSGPDTNANGSCSSSHAIYEGELTIGERSDDEDDRIDSSRPRTDPRWKRFAEWVHCMCIVTFDLELGQAMELIYPKHVRLSEQEATNICYLAFPDSNSGCMGDTQFHIRLRVAPCTQDTLLTPIHRQFNAQCIAVQRADSGHYWGFVYFRQTKDPSLPRGYFQKSFIIITRLPFFNLFYEACSIIAPKYFQDGFSVLEQAYSQICHWPPLQAGQVFTLPLLGTIFQTMLPKSSNKFHSTSFSAITTGGSRSTDPAGNGLNAADCDSDLNSNSRLNESTITNDDESQGIVESVHGPMLPPQVLTSVHEIDIFRSLFSVISHIHLLWELVLIGEPIVVMGSSPDDCSHMVQSLNSLIAPLAYCAETRPYFTIHDSEFKEFTQRSQGPPSIIIGVTNPFFNKPLQNWPHTIRLYDQQLQQSASPMVLAATASLFGNSASIGGVGSTSAHVTAATTAIGSGKLRKIKSFSASKSLDCAPGVYTKYKQFLHKDKSVIKKIMYGVKTKRPASVQSALLRRHLLELTQSFMIPLERYMASLMPLQKDISPFKAAPNPNQFKQDDFLGRLEQTGPHLTSPLKGDWEGLYKRFFRSANFKGWYETREMELRQTLQALQLQALSDADLNLWAQGKHEVEIVDMILKLRQKLQIYKDLENGSDATTMHCLAATNDPNNQIIGGLLSENRALKATTRKHLLQHLETMTQTLPDDLKIILKDT